MEFIVDKREDDGTRVVEYVPRGVCSVLIHVEVKNEKIENVAFTKGCNGNGKGIGALIRGMQVSEAISRLEGITCGGKDTSCPDQLSRVLKAL